MIEGQFEIRSCQVSHLGRESSDWGQVEGWASNVFC